MRAIRGMLAECAPGHTIERKKHHYWVRYESMTFRALPLGEHGKENPEIEIGYIRKMIRHLSIDLDCAKKHLPILRK